MADYFSTIKDPTQEMQDEGAKNILKKDILDNINKNFLYSEGDNLKTSLIDMKRTFNLVMHLK